MEVTSHQQSLCHSHHTCLINIRKEVQGMASGKGDLLALNCNLNKSRENAACSKAIKGCAISHIIETMLKMQHNKRKGSLHKTYMSYKVMCMLTYILLF